MDTNPYELDLDDGATVRARTVVIATGARYRRLERVENVERFESSGIHYAATAIEAALCESEEVVVVGGGNLRRAGRGLPLSLRRSCARARPRARAGREHV